MMKIIHFVHFFNNVPNKIPFNIININKMLFSNGISPNYITSRKINNELNKDRPRKNFDLLLPQTQNLEEIFNYFESNKKKLTKSHYLIILSRLAHLKDKSKVVKNGKFDEILKNMLFLKNINTPKFVSNYIKYLAILGVENKIIWRKLIGTIYKTDFNRNLTEFSLMMNYLQKYHLLNKKLLGTLQTMVFDILDNNPENQSFKIIELLLNGMKNFEIDEDLKIKLSKRMQILINIMPLINLRNSFIPSVKIKFNDDYIWELYNKWFFLRLEKEKNNKDIIISNYSYIIFTYSKSIDEGFIDFKNLLINSKYDNEKNLYDLFYELFNIYKNEIYNNDNNHYVRIFNAFSGFYNLKINDYAEKVLNSLIEDLLINKELQDKLLNIDLISIFLALDKLKIEFKPFEKYSKLLSFFDKYLCEKLFDLDLLNYEKIVVLFLNNEDYFLKNFKIEFESIKNKIISTFEIFIDSSDPQEKVNLENLTIILKSHNWIN